MVVGEKRRENLTSYTEYVREALVDFPAQATLTFKTGREVFFVAVNKFLQPLTWSYMGFKHLYSLVSGPSLPRFRVPCPPISKWSSCWGLGTV